MTFDHRATTAFYGFTLCCRDLPVFHILKRNHRPDAFTLAFQGVDFRHAGGDFVAEFIKNTLNVADLGTQLAFQLANGGFVVRRQNFTGEGHNCLAIFHSKVKVSTSDTLS
ncbi:hypothetical protein D3C86_1599820 [compost metagenome]